MIVRRVKLAGVCWLYKPICLSSGGPGSSKPRSPAAGTDPLQLFAINAVAAVRVQNGAGPGARIQRDFALPIPIKLSEMRPLG